jgi:signal peptidase II
MALRVGLLVASALVVLDQATKELAEAWLVPGRFVPWLSDAVGWQLVYNPGGAFGVPAPAWVFLVVTVAVVAIVVRTLPRSPSVTGAVAYGMLLAGAIGNVLDRLFRPGDPDLWFGGGYVVDFVAWGTFPRFNVADSSITVGFLLLVVALWGEEHRARSSDTAETTDPVGEDRG